MKSTNPRSVGSFYEDDYNTKGCFSKVNNEGIVNLFFGTGGSRSQEAEMDLPGAQERVFCAVPTPVEVETAEEVDEIPTASRTSIPTNPPSEEPENDTVVVSEMRAEGYNNAGVSSSPGLYTLASTAALVSYLYL